ncbi:MAG: hypothetical protein COC10_09700 [Sphingobium sp.]|nr:MAG: hypothetical protein COC10_09700 [Sphingobium sp.]
MDEPRIQRSGSARKLAYSLPEATEATPFSRSTLYALMNSGRLRYRQIGNRRVIPASALHALVGEDV